MSDNNASSTIANAWSGGMKDVNVYLFPCPLCDKSASDQVSEMGKNKKKCVGSLYGRKSISGTC